MLLLIIFISTVVTKMIADKFAGNKIKYRSMSNDEHSLIWFGIGMGAFLLSIFRNFLWSYYACNISYDMFNKLINLIFKKKIEFFDTTPIG